MATEEESEETTQKSTPKAEENAPPKKTQGEEKPVYKFPHQVMMQKIGKKDEDADENTKEYINDFNDFLKHVKMTKASAEKKGQEWKLPDAKKNKLLRLSKSICQSLQYLIDEDEDKKQAIKDARDLEDKKRKYLIEKRKHHSAMIKTEIEEEKQKNIEEKRRAEEEIEKNKKEEDDTYGFWF